MMRNSDNVSENFDKIRGPYKINYKELLAHKDKVRNSENAEDMSENFEEIWRLL